MPRTATVKPLAWESSTNRHNETTSSVEFEDGFIEVIVTKMGWIWELQLTGAAYKTHDEAKAAAEEAFAKFILNNTENGP